MKVIYMGFAFLLVVVTADAQKWVQKSGKFYLQSSEGKMLTPLIYDEGVSMGDGISRVKINDKYGLVNAKGRQLTRIEYKDVKIFGKKLFLVKKENQYTFLKKEVLLNEELIEAYASGEGGEDDFLYTDKQYDGVTFSELEEFAVVELNGKYGYINKEGREVINLIYDDATLFDQDVAAIKIDTRWGAINRKNELIIPLKYNYLSAFDNGKAVAKHQKKWGVISNQEEVLVDFKYEMLGDYKNNLAMAKKDGKWGVINALDDVLIPFEYDMDENERWLLVSRAEKVWFKKDGKWGSINLDGAEVIPFKYDKVLTIYNDGRALVIDNQRTLMIDSNGNCLKNCGE